MIKARNELHRLSDLDYDGYDIPFEVMRDLLAENDGNYWFRTWDNDVMAATSQSGVMMIIFDDKSCLSFMAFRNRGDSFFTFHSPRVLTNKY